MTASTPVWGKLAGPVQQEAARADGAGDLRDRLARLRARPEHGVADRGPGLPGPRRRRSDRAGPGGHRLDRLPARARPLLRLHRRGVRAGHGQRPAHRRLRSWNSAWAGAAASSSASRSPSSPSWSSRRPCTCRRSSARCTSTTSAPILIAGGVSTLLIWVSLAGHNFALGLRRPRPGWSSLGVLAARRRRPDRDARQGADHPAADVPRPHHQPGHLRLGDGRRGDVRLDGLPLAVLPDRPRHEPHPRGPDVDRDGRRPAGLQHRHRPDHQPYRALEAVPGQRHGAGGRRAGTAEHDRRDHQPGRGSAPSWRSWGSASARPCRTSCSRCRTTPPSATWVRPARVVAFFRSMGGSIGVSALGAVLSHQVATSVTKGLAALGVRRRSAAAASHPGHGHPARAGADRLRGRLRRRDRSRVPDRGAVRGDRPGGGALHPRGAAADHHRPRGQGGRRGRPERCGRPSPSAERPRGRPPRRRAAAGSAARAAAASPGPGGRRAAAQPAASSANSARSPGPRARWPARAPAASRAGRRRPSRCRSARGSRPGARRVRRPGASRSRRPRRAPPRRRQPPATAEPHPSAGLSGSAASAAASSTRPARARAPGEPPSRQSIGAATAPNPSTAVAGPYPPDQSSAASGSSAIPVAASTALSSATVAIARGTPRARAARSTDPVRADRVVRSGAAAGTPCTSSRAASVPRTATSGSAGRVRRREQQAAEGGPDHERRDLDGDEQVGGPPSCGAGGPRHRGRQRRVGGGAGSDRGGGREHGDREQVPGDRHRDDAQQHRTGGQGRTEDPVAPEAVRQPSGRPGERDVGQHPGRAGEPQQQVPVGTAAGPFPHQEQQQRPGQRHRHRRERVPGQQPAYVAAEPRSLRPDGHGQPTSRVASGAKPLKPTVE